MVITRRTAVTGSLVLLLLASPIALWNFFEVKTETPSTIETEIARLERIEKHLDPGSVRAMKTRNKLSALRNKRDGGPRPDHPDEFARILYELRVPSDRAVSEYPPGYRARELAKARRDLPLQHSAQTADLPWINRGPGNVAGRARGLVVDPDDAAGNTWYVGSVGGGIWKTTDAGATWIDLAPDLPNLPTSALAMAASNHDVMYAGTGESMFSVDVINGNGILKTVDRGATWQQLASTLDDPRFNNCARILVDPTNPNIVLAAVTTGRYKHDINPRSSIMKSTDGGANWTEVFFETDIGSLSRVKKVLQLAETPGNFNVLYATVDEKGILKSTNAGDTWSWINTGITNFAGRFELAVSPVNTSRLYASAEGSSHSELWVSTNAGASWFETFETGGEPNWLGAQGWYDNTIVCHPTNVNRVYVGGIDLWQIDVSGTNRTTTPLVTGPVHVDNHNLVLIERAGTWRILNANDGGIGVSANEASNWSKPTDGMITSQFYGVDRRPGGSAYVGGMQDNGTWRSPMNPTALDHWTFQIGGDGYETSWHFNDPLKIIGGYQYNGLQRSLDGGMTYTSALSGMTDVGSANAPFITKIAKSNLEPDLLFAVGGQGVWRSTNFGGNWTLAPIGSPNWGPVSSFMCVQISRANPNIVWAGSRMDGTGRINVSTNRGVSFSPTTNYTVATMGGISGLSTHPADSSTAYALFSFAHRPKILMTTNLGASWIDMSGFGSDTVSANGFPDVAVYDLLVRPDDTNTIWAGTEIGLFESTDAGETWHMANNGLPAVPIWDMTHVEDEIVLATHGRGIWSVTIPGLDAGQTYAPLLETLAQGPDGFLSISLNLRSAYDSTRVFVDGSYYATLPANSPQDMETVQVPVVAPATRTVKATAFKGASTYDTPLKSIDVVPFSPAQATYSNDFNVASSDFVGDGFVIGPAAGFSNDAIHSAHPYADQYEPTYLLTVPIVLGDADAMISYDDVALVEPGEPGAVFGDFDFWDYVVVEGSLDGLEWQPVADGYDANLHAAWRSAWDSSTPGSSSLYRHHEVDLFQTFSPGDEILLRFRLYADAFVNGWGWAIDNLAISSTVTAAEDLQGPAGRVVLHPASPNPLTSSTTLRFELPEPGPARLLLFDVNGRLVRRLVEETSLPAGAHQVAWDAREEQGRRVAAGVYLYRLQAGRETRMGRVTVLK